MQNLETKSLRPRPKSFETWDLWDRDRDSKKRVSRHRDTSQDRDQISRLHHWCLCTQM